MAEREFSPGELVLLEAFCAAHDCWSEAQKVVKAEGVVVNDRFGAPRAHPATTIAKDAAATMARLGAQLDLELEDDLGSVRHPHASRPGPRR